MVANQSQEKFKEQQLRAARLIKETFSTEAGRQVWSMLLPYFHQQFRPDMKPEELAFHAGQRDVVHYLQDMMNLSQQPMGNVVELGEQQNVQ